MVMDTVVEYLERWDRVEWVHVGTHLSISLFSFAAPGRLILDATLPEVATIVSFARCRRPYTIFPIEHVIYNVASAFCANLIAQDLNIRKAAPFSFEPILTHPQIIMQAESLAVLCGKCVRQPQFRSLMQRIS